MKQLKQALTFFWAYLRAYKPQGIVIILAIISTTYLQVRAPLYLGQAMEAMVNYVTEFFTTGVQDHSELNQIIVRLAIVYILMTITYITKFQVMAGVSGKASNRMRIAMFQKLEKLTIKFFDTRKDGDILARFTSDMEHINDTMNVWLIQILMNISLIVGLLIMMLQLHLRMAVATIFTIPIAVLLAILCIRKTNYYAKKMQQNVGELNAYVDERISGQKMVITNGIEEQCIEGFLQHNERVNAFGYKNQFYAGIVQPLMTGMSLINIAIIVFIGTTIAFSGDIPRAAALGLIVTFLGYSQSFYRPLTDLSTQYSAMQLGIAGAGRVQEVLLEETEQQQEDMVEIDGIHQGVQLKDVDFAYVPGKQVLKEVNLTVDKGQMVALVGTTGCGKTTIMNLLNRFYDVNQGSILIDGVESKKISLASLRQNIGIVLQDSILFHGTIRENIAFGRPEATYEEVIQAAKLAGIHDFIEELEEGYETLVSEEDHIFSVGQKQLMSIARTTITNPSLLILDEATSNVDTVTESRLQKAMNHIISGRTSIVIAHRLKTILNADKIVVMHEGEIIEEGNHETLLKKMGFYHDLYHNQFVLEQ